MGHICTYGYGPHTLYSRAQYTSGGALYTKFSNVRIDTATARPAAGGDSGRAVFVEQCQCPRGYTGLSCQARRNLQSGEATCSEGFVKCCLIVPQAVGMYCSCHAAQASKVNKHITKPSEQVAAPDCRSRASIFETLNSLSDRLTVNPNQGLQGNRVWLDDQTHYYLPNVSGVRSRFRGGLCGAVCSDDGRLPPGLLPRRRQMSNMSLSAHNSGKPVSCPHIQGPSKIFFTGSEIDRLRCSGT